MKFALIVGVTLLGLLRSFVYSQDDNVFHEAQNALALVPSLSYRVQTYEQDAPKASSTLEWHEWKDSYRFLFQQFDGIQNETLRTEVSYDGKAVMTSTDGGRTVYVEEGVQKPLPDYIRAQQMLLAPFDFVLNSAVQHYWETPCLQHLQSREVWTTLMTRCKLMPDEEVGDKRLKVVEVKGGREKFSGVPISYKVYLDVDTKFPHCVKTYDTSGRLLSELTVSRFGALKLSNSDKEILCPAEIIVKYFGFGSDGDKSEMTNWQRFVFEDIVAAPSVDVALDLAASEMIYDVVNKAVIPIPR